MAYKQVVVSAGPPLRTPLARQRDGINRLLCDLYKRRMLISDILRRHGLQPTEIDCLRRNPAEFYAAFSQELTRWLHRILPAEVFNYIRLLYSLDGFKSLSPLTISLRYNVPEERIEKARRNTLRYLLVHEGYVERLEQLAVQSARKLLARRVPATN